MYVPGVLRERFMTPVLELMDSPAVDEYVPPVVNPAPGEGEGLLALAQTGDE